jgi:hypothetical protein
MPMSIAIPASVADFVMVTSFASASTGLLSKADARRRARLLRARARWKCAPRP